MNVQPDSSMPAYKITKIEFDLDDALETDFVDRQGKVITKDQLQQSLQKVVLNEIFVVDEEDEVVDFISDKYGWCVLSSNVEKVPYAEYTVYGLSWGESNDVYGRGKIALNNRSELAIIRAIKKEIGWTNKRCRKEDYSDSIELFPSGLLQKCVIDFIYH